MSANAGVHQVTGGLERYRAGGDLGTVVDVRTGTDMPGRPPGWRLRPPRRLPRSRRRGARRNGRRAQGARVAPDRADQPLLFPFRLFSRAGRRVVRNRDPTVRASPSTSRKRCWATRSSCRSGTGPAVPRSWRRCRRLADRRRGKASLGAAMEPQNSFLHAGRGAYSFSARTRTKQLCLRMGMRRKRSVHSRWLSQRILALTSPLTILPTQ